MHPELEMTAEKVVEDGLANLLSRRILREGLDGVRVEDGQDGLLEYYARSISHLF
jgi:uncharacterized protein YheU (UPF0270 family)